MRRTTMLVVTALFAVLGVTAPASATASASTAAPASATASNRTMAPSGKPADGSGTTLFIGMAGLTWADIDAATTPNLHRLARRSDIASLTARSVGKYSCPVDGWLAVSAGRRAADSAAGCRPPARPVDGTVPHWHDYVQQAKKDDFNAAPGKLGAALPTPAAIGPGAAIALSDPSGQVDDYLSVPDDPHLLQSLVAAKFDDHHLVALDLGNVAGAGPNDLAALDDRVGAALDGAGTDTTVIAASLADGAGPPKMQFAAMRAPGLDPGLLTSDSTRQPGLIQAVDIGPTLQSLVSGHVPTSDAGAPIVRGESGPDTASGRIASMHDRAQAVQTQLALSTWFFPVLIALMLAAGLAGVLGIRVRRRTTLVAARVVGLVFAAVPVSTFLVNLLPWASAPHPAAAMLACLVGFSAAITAVALVGPWRRYLLGPLAVIAAITVGTLAADVLTGSSLQMSTLMGEPLLTASRFYGIGNSAYALFASALVLLVVIALRLPVFAGRPGVRVLVVAAVGITAGLLLGLPGLGTKFGSVPTIVVGFGLLALTAAGRKFTWRRGVVLVIGAAALMTALLYVDWLRPPDQRTHFGRFFQTLLDGGAGPVIGRKISMNLGILTQSWMTLLLPLFVIAVAIVVLRPLRVTGLDGVYARTPYFRAGLGALFTLLILGAFVNDSGIIVPAVGILLLAPALTHVGATHALGMDLDTNAGPPPRPVPRA